MKSEEELILENKLQQMQGILDAGWKRQRPVQRYINGHAVSEEEYWEYKEKEEEDKAWEDAELSFYKRCTSTGEEWEIDSDGLEYIP